jgi:WD40 repeat protein
MTTVHRTGHYSVIMHNYFHFTPSLVCTMILAFGCAPVPIPMSTVILQSRAERPFVLESAESEKGGVFSSPAFDPSGEFLAVYDSGSEMVRIFSMSDMTPINAIKPSRWPRRLSFSPGGRFLVIEGWQGWIEDSFRGKPFLNGVAIDSPEAIKDDVQRVEVWDLRTGRTVPDLACDAVAIDPPEAGWLWARKTAVLPGLRSSALLLAHFTSDESELSALCWNGVQQRWDSRTWERLETVQPPLFWEELTRRMKPGQWTGDSASGRSADGRFAVVSVREKSFGFRTTYIWDRNEIDAQPLPGDCGTMGLPAYLLSGDGSRIVLICSNGMGYSVRAWDLVSGREIPLKNADFGVLRGGDPLPHAQSVAMSPDGRFVAGALNLHVAMMGTGTIDRIDLKLWSMEQDLEPVTVPIDDLSRSFRNYFFGIDLAFSPDSSMLAVCGTKLRIYRVSDLDAAPQ